MNTAIATQSGGYQGIGFALPINTAVKVYNQIIKTGQMTRGAIGVSLSVQPDPELLQVYGAKSGAFVQGVEPEGPAEKAGIREGDVVVAMNGKPVHTGDELTNAVADAGVGSEVRGLTVIRDGKEAGHQSRGWRPGQVFEQCADCPKPSGRPSNGESTEAKVGIFLVRNLAESRPGRNESQDSWRRSGHARGSGLVR